LLDSPSKNNEDDTDTKDESAAADEVTASNNIENQVDRDDDVDEDEEHENKMIGDIDVNVGANFGNMIDQETCGPINLADLRISMP
jgi:hypothetical protein